MKRMLEEFGLKFIAPHWHFWIALAINLVINFLLNINPRIYLQYKWLYFILPIFFSVVVYFALGIIIGQLGVLT